MSNLVEYLLVYKRGFSAAHEFIVDDDEFDAKKTIEDYIRDRIYSEIGRGMLRDIPQNRSLKITWHENVTLIEELENARFKRYRMIVSIYVEEL